MLRPETPWLSVIMPTYNGEQFLAAALASVQSQQLVPIEVIAVDDGSTDSTLSILESFAPKLNLRILREAHAGNWVKTTNLGLREATGKYVCFLHQDDYWLPGRIEHLCALARSLPHAVLLLHDSEFVDPQGKRMGAWRCPFPKKCALLPEQYVSARLMVQNFIAIPAPIWKRESLESIGGLDEALWFTSDWKLWLQLSQLGPWGYLPESLSCFRLHPGAQTITGARNLGSFKEQYDRVLDEFLPGVRPDVAPLARFSSATNQALAAAFHSHRASWRELLIDGLRLGPLGWYRYFHYSRIFERVSARLRVKLGQPQTSTG